MYCIVVFDYSLLIVLFFHVLYLTPVLYYCSKVIDAQSPMAIVIPARGSSFSMILRDNDISWESFLERGNGSR